MKNLFSLLVILSVLFASKTSAQRFAGSTTSTVSIDSAGKNTALLQWSQGGDGTILQYRSRNGGVMKNISVTGHKYRLEGLTEGALFEWRLKNEQSGAVSAINSFNTYQKIAPSEDSTAGNEVYMLQAKPKEYLQVHKIYENFLNIRCEQKTQNEKYAYATLYNWKKEEVSRLAFVLDGPVNNYLIDLFSLGINWELEVTYVMEFSRPYRSSEFIQLELAMPPEKLGPQLEIVVNPLEVSCDDPSIFEFYGSIYGGKAPYEVVWAIVDQDKRLLTAPVEARLENKAEVAKIVVEHMMDFTVVLAVEDACGNFQETELKVSCDDDDLTNTIFLETTNPLKKDNPPKSSEFIKN